MGDLFVLIIIIVFIVGIVKIIQFVLALKEKAKSVFTKSRHRHRSGISIELGSGSTRARFRNRQVSRPIKSDMRWIGLNDEITIRTYKINDPLTYVSKSKPPSSHEWISYGDFEEDEASCIYTSLKVGRPVYEPPGALGYWPKYAQISADQRANYLRWLANGRNDELEDIGYAFIFFYGLERRLLVEKKDFRIIMGEVVRLLDRYTHSGSFTGYLARFLTYVAAKYGLDKIDDPLFWIIFEKSPARRTEEGLSVALAWMHIHGHPLSTSWAMDVARMDPRSPRSVVTKRIPGEFKKLFDIKYKEKYGKGLVLKASKIERKLEYHPASPSLGTLHSDYDDESAVIQPIRIPNIMGIQSQFKELVEIWTECIDELKPLARKVGKGMDVDTREAFEALPDDLRKELDHPDHDKWEHLAQANMREDGVVLLSVSDLAKLKEIGKRDRLTKKQGESIAETAEYIGYVIEPDIRLTNRTYKWDDKVCLLRPDIPDKILDCPRYLGSAIILELGMAIAAADGVIEDEEVSHIVSFLEGRFMLDTNEEQRIKALKEVLVASPPSMNGVARRLQKALKPDQLEKVGTFLVGVAAADGIIDKNEINILKKAYKALGLTNDKLNEVLDSIVIAPDAPVEVQRGRKRDRKGELIPARKEKEEFIEVILDENRIREILEDTREVSDILSAVFQEEDFGLPEGQENAAQEPAQCLEPATDPRFEDLDSRFHSFLCEVLTKEEWDSDEFTNLARSYNLMPSGAIEKINEWAEQKYDDLLMEESDKIYINKDILPEHENVKQN